MAFPAPLERVFLRFWSRQRTLPKMKCTFLAIGLAALVSMLFTPHSDHRSVLDGVRWKSRHEAYYTERKADVFDQVDSQGRITVAGHGRFEFPAEMTPDQIRDALRKKFPSDKEIVFKAATSSWRRVRL
jgi:hypothetical protein